jgi:hypothetical protein
MVRAMSFLVFALLICGCGSNLEPAKAAKPLDSSETKAAGFQKLPKPATSDSQAVDLVRKIIAAHTNNDPALLEKMKSFAFSRDGKHRTPGSQELGSPMKFEIQARWPNRARYVMTGGMPVPITVRIVDQQVMRHAPSPLVLPPIPENQIEDNLIHYYGDGFQLLLPLTDPAIVVALDAKLTLGDKTLQGLRVWKDGKPQVLLHIDPATNLLARITYEGREQGLTTLVEVALSEYRPVNGFQLAHRAFVRMNGRDFIEFEKASLEFPREHADKVFTEP